MSNVLWTALGGAAGAMSRMAVQSLFQRCWPQFPWGTWAVNIVGCFAIGVFLATGITIRPGWDRSLFCTGFLGSLTTMSAFSAETVALAQNGQRLQAQAYVLGTISTCLLAAWLGTVVGSLLLRSAPSGDVAEW